MKKMYYIEKIETALLKQEILERVKEITKEEKFSLNGFAGKYLCHGRFDKDMFSVLNMEKGDLLSPRITGKVLEKEDGCVVELFSGMTEWIYICLVWWTFFVFITIQAEVLNVIGHIVVYILGILFGRMQCVNSRKKVIRVLKREVFLIKEEPTISTEIREAERQLEEQYKGIVK